MSLDIVNNAIKARQLGEQELLLLRDDVLSYIRNMYGDRGSTEHHMDPMSIQNKITQTVTNLFSMLYATQWTSFFSDILAMAGKDRSNAKDHAPGVMFYLRVLISVHDEIAEVLLPRSSEE